jgi:hypothetical protein
MNRCSSTSPPAAYLEFLSVGFRERRLEIVMTPKELRALREVQLKLRSTSFPLYKEVMNDLFLCHSKYEFVRILHGHFRSQRYDLALAYADSMSEQQYTDAAMHFAASQFASLVKKYPWPKDLSKTDPEAAAIGSFLKSERRCKRLNKRFKLYASLRSPHEEKFSRIRSFIQFTIGVRPNLEAILDQADFGAGASIGVHGNATHLAAKLLAKEWTVTPSAAVYAYWALMRNYQTRDLLLESRGPYQCLDWDFSREKFRSKVRMLRYNKVAFVPKTAKTHRAIAVEPLLNGFLQKGADNVLRTNLERIGIDLRDQSLNRELARQGSASDSDESFVTIDLSSASDSISIGLARFVLPVEWFEFLNSLRPDSYMLDGKLNVYHKFCSMGNGFCFPLETLLFVACCSAVGCGIPGTDFSVYGDDIIVKRKYANDVLSLLKAMGFQANRKKTFLQGPFRESCGADWYKGEDVRPYILDYALDSLQNIFKWVNLTRRNAFATRFFEGTYDKVLSNVPEQFRYWRPYKGEPDTGLDSTGSEHLSSPLCVFDRRRMVWRVKALRHVPIADMAFGNDSRRHSSVDMYAVLRGAQSRRFRVQYTLRRETRTTIVRKDNVEATSCWLPPQSFVK